MMATKATIKIDYDKTMRQVIKLEEIASKVDALGNKHLEDILQAGREIVHRGICKRGSSFRRKSAKVRRGYKISHRKSKIWLSAYGPRIYRRQLLWKGEFRNYIRWQ